MYVKGIRDLRGHIYAENYSPEIAAVRTYGYLILLDEIGEDVDWNSSSIGDSKI